jgi:tetratricopeptide (TPR) repeat protein
MRKELRALYKRLMILSVMLSLLFTALAAGFSQWSARALPGLSATLAEVAMQQGQRREAGGELEEARRFYEQALAGKFHDEANRNRCETRLGVVLRALGDKEAALEHLTRAQAGPHQSLDGFGPLVDVLMALERWEEAKGEAERWHQASEGDPENCANALRALGRIALHGGALDIAEGHLLGALDLDGMHAARADLAQVYAARGDVAQAREAMIAFLASAPPDDDTAAHWALLESWMPQGITRGPAPLL